MDYQMQSPFTGTFVKAGFAAGTTNTFSTSALSLYALRGVALSRAAFANAAVPTTDFVTGRAFEGVVAGEGAQYLFGVDAAGNARVVASPKQALDAAGNFVVLPLLPPVPDNFVPFGLLTIRAGATAVGAWTLGVSNLSAVTGITYGFTDLVNLPDRPRAS